MENLTASPFINTVRLNWNEAKCNQKTNGNKLIGYDVYRKNDCDTWAHQPGETGIPASAGYEWIGSADDSTTTFLDDNKGTGLTIAASYTYIVVCRYKDGAQSYASEGKCVLITNTKELKINTAEITIAPNPNDGTFHIKSSYYNNSNVTISVKNWLGQLLYQKSTLFSTAGESVSVNLESGVYLLEIENKSGRSLQKISITR